MDLREILVRPVRSFEEQRYQELMGEHHYLGSLPKISETLWYVVVWRDEWVALLGFSASALKCAARDRWIGWDYRHQYGRLKLVVNNSRFLIMPDWHVPNLGSRILSLCQRRLCRDWKDTFGHPVLLLETFVDPQRFHGTVYRAANWAYLGNTRGFRRTRQGYAALPQSPKMVFVKPLQADARELLSSATLAPPYCTGGSKMMLSANQMQSLPSFFADIPDPRRSQGRRHRLSTVLAIAAGAILCGMRGYKAISDFAKSLSQKSRQRFGCRCKGGRYGVPSEYIIRDILIRVEPAHLDRALQRWNEIYATKDDSLAIDGKTMCNAIDDQGHQTHIMSVIGHQSKTCHTQIKVGALPVKDSEEVKRTNEIKMAIPMLDAIDIQGKDVSADALLTQRKRAEYLVTKRQAHYHFTVKRNQSGVLQELELYFQDRQEPHVVEHTPPDHGRIETREIWTTTELNDYLNFPHVGQAFIVERHAIEKKSGKTSLEIAYGITSRTPEQADPQRILKVNREHWTIENSCHYILDWNYDEDRGRIRTGYGPQNITRLRRFAIGVIKSKGARSVAQKMRQLIRNVRLVFDYLRMTQNSCACTIQN